jgi:hypothetical protein
MTCSVKTFLNPQNSSEPDPRFLPRLRFERERTHVAQHGISRNPLFQVKVQTRRLAMVTP